MKLSKSELKSVIKECLVEILSEGLGNSSLFTEGKTKKEYSENYRSDSQQAKAPRRQFAPSSSLKEAIKRESAGNPIMESIFADTASKTLPGILEHDKPGARPVSLGAAEQIVASVDPQDLFGEETSSKWASLAFAGPIGKQ